MERFDEIIAAIERLSTDVEKLRRGFSPSLRNLLIAVPRKVARIN